MAYKTERKNKGLTKMWVLEPCGEKKKDSGKEDINEIQNVVRRRNTFKNAVIKTKKTLFESHCKKHYLY